MNKIITKNYERAQKRTAERLYNEGENIYIIGCNMHPENLWEAPTMINNVTGRSFEQILNEVEYYNCDSDRGHYLSYYIKREVTT